jgi:hypothetical protein
MNVEFKAENIKLLESAATSLNWTFITEEGKITVYAPGGPIIINMITKTAQAQTPTDINLLKQSYSRQAVKKAASDKGWTLDTWKDTAGIKKTIAIKY